MAMRRRLAATLMLWLAAATWAAALPQVPELAVARAAQPVVVDGDLRDAAWQTASTIPLLLDYQSGRPAAFPTRVRLVWDDDALTFGFVCEEPAMASLRATVKERDGGVWGDDSVEVFLQPLDLGYCHFIVNALGTLLDERGQDVSWNSQAQAAARREGQRWTCELRIPWADLGGRPAAGVVWGGNVCRGRHVQGEQLLSWSMTGGGFHNADRFGHLRFVTQSPVLTELDPGVLLPGVNTLRARLVANTPSRLQLGAADGASARADVAAKSGTVTTTYELAPDDLAVPLRCTMRASDGTVAYAQSLLPTTAATVRVGVIRALLGRLSALPAADAPPAWRQDLTRAAKSVLADLDQALTRARRTRTTLSPEAWGALAERLDGVAARAMQPIVWTSAMEGKGDPPPPGAAPASLDFTLCQNQRDFSVLRLRCPLLAGAARVRVGLSQFTHAAGESGQTAVLPLSRLDLFEAVPVPLKGGGTVADPLVPLPAAGVTTLDGAEVRELWLRVNASGVAPGYYLGQLTLTPLLPGAGPGTVAVPIRVRVWPLELPAQMPISTFVCDYRLSARSPAHFQDLISHRTNVFNTNVLPSPDDAGHADFSQMAEGLKLSRDHGMQFEEVWFMRDSGWRPQYAEWVRGCARAMEAAGIPFDRWMLHIYDETMCPEFLECAKQIKAVEPRIRIFSDLMGTPEQIAAFAPVVDYWCPFWGDLGKNGGKSLAQMKATGKPVWTYDCGSAKTVPTTRYRALPWVTWRHKLDGAFCWCYPGSAWDERGVADINYGHIYEGYRGEPVSSKRWEAWGAGLEDFLMLRAYDEALAAHGAPAPEDKALLAKLNDAAETGMGTPVAYTALRRELAHRILALRGRPVGADFPRAAQSDWIPRALGDGKGSIFGETGGHRDPADLVTVLRSPSAQSWTFIVKPVAARLKQHVRLRAFVKGRGALRLGLCEGFAFGDDPSGHHIADRYVRLTDAWQEVLVDLDITQQPVQAFAGFDYGQAEAEAIISDLEIAVTDSARPPG